MTDSIFTPATPEQEVSAEAFIGEGKRWKSADDLLRGKLAADQAIKDREAELSLLRAELEKRLSVEEALNKFQQPPREQAPAQPVVAQPATPAATSDEDLARRVSETVSKIEEQRIAASNAEVVSSKLLSIYGDEAKASVAVNAKARELGLTVQDLQSIAVKSPRAFFAQMGITDNPTQGTPSPSRSDVLNVPPAQGAAKTGTYAYYEGIRKSDPSRYFSPQVQNQLHKDAIRLGEAFFA